ncbi:MAG: leucyl/phenylalanyl-tRNA--protein transferase [Opitutales bacterium]
MSIHVLGHHLGFPDPRFANADGLLAVGGDLRIERLLAAYEHGIFPWYSEGQPILWFSPDPRLVLIPKAFKASKSLTRARRSGKFETRFDTAFGEVIRKCSSIRRTEQDGTWITDEMITAYEKLHQIGRAHSVETFLDDELVGGLYGVSMGRAFFGESMFHEVSDCSKIALWALADRLNQWDFDLIDCQMTTPLLASLGAKEIPREEFLEKVRISVAKEHAPKDWGASVD